MYQQYKIRVNGGMRRNDLVWVRNVPKGPINITVRHVKTENQL